MFHFCVCKIISSNRNITVFLCCINSTSYFTSFVDKRQQHVTVARSNVRKDVIEIFSDSTILSCTLHVVVVDARGEAEAGRGKGVLLEGVDT